LTLWQAAGEGLGSGGGSAGPPPGLHAHRARASRLDGRCAGHSRCWLRHCEIHCAGAARGVRAETAAGGGL
jgi:hypothetical protein